MTTAFYTVADSRYFVGLVALVNSLRLVGHEEPIRVLDCGLTDDQRELLGHQAEFVRSPAARSPMLVTGSHVVSRPAPLMVLLDSDVIVTRSLAPLVHEAEKGTIVAAADPLADRFYPEWSELLELGPLRRHTYVNNGVIAFPESLGVPLFELTNALQARLNPTWTRLGRARPMDPLYLLDQDILNAVLGMDGWIDRLSAVEGRLMPCPPFRDLRLLDARTLDCRYPDGTQPFALHHIQRKPWLTPTPRSVYSQLLPRLVLWPDVPVRLDEGMLPLRFRSGPLARLDRARAEVQARVLAPRSVIAGVFDLLGWEDPRRRFSRPQGPPLDERREAD